MELKFIKTLGQRVEWQIIITCQQRSERGVPGPGNVGVALGEGPSKRHLGVEVGQDHAWKQGCVDVFGEARWLVSCCLQ